MSKFQTLELRVGNTDSLFRIKKTDASKLQDEYAKLVEGLQEAAHDEDTFMSNPGQDRTPSMTAVQLSYGTVLPEDLLKEAVPGNIRKAEHFVAFLKRLVEYLKVSPLYSISRSGATPICTNARPDPYACAACCRRDAALFSPTFERYHLH
jgi:Helical and beta-bridge domain